MLSLDTNNVDLLDTTGRLSNMKCCERTDESVDVDADEMIHHDLRSHYVSSAQHEGRPASHGTMIRVKLLTVCGMVRSIEKWRNLSQMFQKYYSENSNSSI